MGFSLNVGGGLIHLLLVVAVVVLVINLITRRRLAWSREAICNERGADRCSASFADQAVNLLDDG